MKPAKLINRNGTLYIKRRVPARFRPIEDREFVWLSLHTDSETVAHAKAPLVWTEMLEAWEARLSGADTDSSNRMAAAKDLAARRGYSFMSAPEVAKLPIADLLARVESVLNRKGEIDIIEAEALLGGARASQIKVSGILKKYWEISKDKVVGKSEDQLRRWRNPRKKAVATFLSVVGDRELTDITNADMQIFRGHLVDRMAEGELDAGSVNKDIIHFVSTVKAVALVSDFDLSFKTAGLHVKEGKRRTRPPLPAAWISTKLLKPGALDGLNGEARAILMGMVNTGYRPSEGAMLTRAQIRLDCDVPHISIEPVTRRLKTDHSERIIPLAGISLAAFKEFPDGFPRYTDSASLTATVNKYLRENGLFPSDEHSMYGLRHSFEDRLLAAGVDERIRSDLMGHTIKRERYGAGADLNLLLKVIQLIAL
jgi:integrase